MRIDFEQRAHHHLGYVFNRWFAGRFTGLSPAGQCYAALEELRWGDFGDYCRTKTGKVRTDLLDDLINRTIIQLRADTRVNSSTIRPPISVWLDYPINMQPRPELKAAVTYMRDWSTPEPHPFVYTVSQTPNTLPLALPGLCTVERLSEAIVPEVMQKNENRNIKNR